MKLIRQNLISSFAVFFILIQYECYFYKASEEGVYSYDVVGVEWYNLDRGATNDSCPLAEIVFPAVG
ncbi:hypothetical protein V3C99_011490 [Haemonchus contortus]